MSEVELESTALQHLARVERVYRRLRCKETCCLRLSDIGQLDDAPVRVGQLLSTPYPTIRAHHDNITPLEQLYVEVWVLVELAPDPDKHLTHYWYPGVQPSKSKTI